MHPGLPADAANAFLAEWAVRDPLAATGDAEAVAARWDEPAQRAMYAAAMRLLDDLCDRPLPPAEPGELRVTMRARWGEEHRWQLAALIADVLVLQYYAEDGEPRIDPFLSLRDACSNAEPDDGPRQDGPWPHGTEPRSVQPVDPALDALLDSLDFEPDPLEQDSPGQAVNAVLPRRLGATLRFLSHLSAVRSGSTVLLARPDLTSFASTWNSVRGVYYWNGQWGCSDPGDWATPPPPAGAVTLKQAVDAAGAVRADLEEVVASYALGGNDGLGHLPLVPTREAALIAATEFYSRFRRLHLANPLVALGPQGDLADSTASTDWRPALSDRLLLHALPAVATADADAFSRLHGLPKLADFRRRLRVDAERVEGLNASETARRLSEIARELNEAAAGASAALAAELATGRRKMLLSSGVVGLIASAGFISFGPAGAAAGGLIASSLTAAVESRRLDPAASMTGTELALVMLSPGSPA